MFGGYKRGQLTMMNMRKINILFLCFSLAIIFTVAMTAPVSAATNVFEFDVEFSEMGMDPKGPAPWLTATFDDTADAIGANGVRLTMSAGNLVNQEFVNDWYFNFDDNLDVTQLSFAAVDITDTATFNTMTDISTSKNFFMSDGDGNFDMLFDFTTSNGQNGIRRFGAGDEVIIDITYTDPITVSSFDFFSEMDGEQGTYLAAAMVQSISDPSCTDPGDPYCGSGFIGVVPEPVSSTLFIVGAVSLGARLFWKKRKSS
jgi:hypothetical protein